MKCEIQGSGVEIDQDVRQFVSQRIDSALGRRSDHIVSVLVHLGDTGSVEDAGDKSCLVQVRLHGIADIRVESTDADLYIASHRAVDRAGWSAARGILRQQRKVIASLLNEPEQAA